jgi:tetratricopeptide (TPR) repeat protein
LSGYRVAKLDEIDEMTDGREPWRPIRHHFGIQAFGINSWTARDAGDRIINEHEEEGDDGDEELYVVLRGHATFEVGDDKVDAPGGTLVFVPPGTRRTAFAEEAGTTVLAVGAPKGKAYEVVGWELWAPALPSYSSGDYEKAIEIMAPILAEHPEYPGLFFNLACLESLAGHRDDAIEHLRVAIERAPRFKESAKTDTDFDPIRDEPAFRELVGA